MLQHAKVNLLLKKHSYKCTAAYTYNIYKAHRPVQDAYGLQPPARSPTCDPAWVEPRGSALCYTLHRLYSFSFLLPSLVPKWLWECGPLTRETAWDTVGTGCLPPHRGPHHCIEQTQELGGTVSDLLPFIAATVTVTNTANSLPVLASCSTREEPLAQQF